MLESWIFWTLLAACMQSVRTATQKHLTTHVSAEGATLVRYLFGLPFAVLYLLYLLQDQPLPSLNLTFLLCAVFAGIFQIIATVLLIRLFTLRNFAVGGTYVRAEIVMTAMIGAAFFGDMVPWLGFAAISVCFAGLVVISLDKSGKLSSLWNLSAAYGLGAGLAFSVTSLLIRKGSLSLGLDGAMLPAAIMLTTMVTLQTLISLLMVAVINAREIKTIFVHWKPSVFVGLTSVLGSAGWFTAFTLEKAAYVKTLGQVEFIISLAISVFYFGERPTRPEFIGMALIISGVLLLLLAAS